MLKWFNKNTTSSRPSPGDAKVSSPAGTIVYPPSDQGIPVEPIGNVISSQIELLKSIRLAAAMTEAEYKRLYVPLIKNFASYIHLLPATRDANHRGAGGLFRLGLEVGYHSLQASGGVIFAGLETTENRRIMEPRWVYASFVAGLCSDLHYSINSVVVLNEKGDQWPAYQTPLYDWLISTGSQRYFIKWNAVEADEERMAANTTFLLNKIIPNESAQYMRDGSNKIVHSVMGVITRSIPNAERNTLRNIVYEIRKLVIERDSSLQPDHYGRMTVGTHIEPYIMDAMRNLYSREVWKLNQSKARMWLAPEGLYIVWKTGGQELLKELHDSKVPGMPKHPETLLEMLVSGGIIDTNEEQATFLIHPPGASAPLSAIRLSNPQSLLKELADSAEKHSNLLVSDHRIIATEGKNEKAKAADEELSKSETSSKSNIVESQRQMDEGGAPSPVPESVCTIPEPVPVSEEVIQEQPGKDIDIGENAKAILAGLAPHMREIMNALIQDALKLPPDNDVAFPNKDGFVVATDMLQGYGFPLSDVVKDLKTVGWLWYPPGKRDAKVQVIERNGKKVTAVVILADIAKSIGLPVA